MGLNRVDEDIPSSGPLFSAKTCSFPTIQRWYKDFFPSGQMPFLSTFVLSLYPVQEALTEGTTQCAGSNNVGKELYSKGASISSQHKLREYV